MPNIPCNFITCADDGHGSSLYCVSANWIIRCSGNTKDDRDAQTFIRMRDIVYVTGGTESPRASTGSYPKEGKHDGNKIVVVFPYISLREPRSEWRAENGVSWETAVKEIDDGIAYAQDNPMIWRASRKVGKTSFLPDPHRD